MALEGLRDKLFARERVARLQQERFEAWEFDRRQRDEITDQAERLTTPMRNTFLYTLGEHGLQTDLGEPLNKVMVDGIAEAERQAAIDPQWQFEVNRRRIEHEELQQVEAFARAGSPDDVISISSISLDGSDYEAMQSVVAGLGYELPGGLGSEDILAQRYWLGEPPEALVVLSPCPDAVVHHGADIGGYNRERRKMLARVVTRSAPFHDDILDAIRDNYDQSLTRQHGGEWYAGRPPLAVKDAMEFIAAQKDLLAGHMKIVQDVFAAHADRDTRMAMLGGPRYNLAAALDDRLNGRHVSSLGDAGERARAEGRSFEGDCPPGGLGSTLSSASSQLETLGYVFPPKRDGIDKCVNCPFCKKVVDARRKNEVNPLTNKMTVTYTCLSSGCKIDTKTGQRIDQAAKKRKQLAKAGKMAVAAK